MSDYSDPALREIVKQAMQRSHLSGGGPGALEPVDVFLEQLHPWGCLVVSRFDVRLAKAQSND